MRVVSIDSLLVSGGRIVGTRFASIVLPEPGGPIISTLCIPAAAIARNVKGCWNLGSCGMGCPTNAKQSMLVTTIPAAANVGVAAAYADWSEVRGAATQLAVNLTCIVVAVVTTLTLQRLVYRRRAA